MYSIYNKTHRTFIATKCYIYFAFYLQYFLEFPKPHAQSSNTMSLVKSTPLSLFKKKLIVEYIHHSMKKVPIKQQKLGTL